MPKQEVAAAYLPKEANQLGLFVVLIERASAATWHVEKTSDGRIKNLERKYAYVNHYYFHILDAEWGHVTIRMSGHPPFGVQVILNGHEYIERQALNMGYTLAKSGNCFTISGCNPAKITPAQNANRHLVRSIGSWVKPKTLDKPVMAVK